MSQKSALLTYLQAGNTLTGLQGLSLFGSLSIRNRISELRAEGYDIKDEIVRGENGKRYCRYWLSTKTRTTVGEQMEFVR